MSNRLELTSIYSPQEAKEALMRIDWIHAEDLVSGEYQIILRSIIDMDVTFAMHVSKMLAYIALGDRTITLQIALDELRKAGKVR